MNNGGLKQLITVLKDKDTVRKYTTDNLVVTFETGAYIPRATALTRGDTRTWVNSGYWGDSRLPTLYRNNTPKEMLLHPSVYILFHYGTPVYVGQSVRPYVRIDNHIQQKEKMFDSFRVLKCVKHKMNYWEGYLIYKLQPKYNIVGKRFKRGCISETVREERHNRNKR